MKTYPFTFQDTGVEITIQKVSPAIAADARRALGKGKPHVPTRLITMDGPLKGTLEKVDDDPQYLEDLALHEQMVEEKINQLYIKRGVVEIVTKGWQQDVKDYRGLMSDIGIDTLQEDDKTLYITRLAPGSNEDLQELFSAIMMRSEPTEEVIQEHVDTFSGDV